MLAQIYYLDIVFDGHKYDQPHAQERWEKLYRVNYLLCVDMLVDFDAQSTEDYGILYGNILYTLRRLEFEQEPE